MNKGTLLIFSVLVGCTDKASESTDTGGEDTGIYEGGDGADGTDGTDGTDGGGTAITPAEGSWAITDGVLGSNTCGGDVEIDSGALYATLAMTGDASFELIFDDGMGLETASCTMEGAGGGFSCDGQDLINDFTEYDIDAVLTIGVVFSGSLDSPTAGNLSLQADYSCEGTECDGVLGDGMELPCAIEGLYTLTFEG